MINNQSVSDQKPNNQAVSGQTQTYTETRVIQAGMLIPITSLTYPTAGTFVAVRI